MRLRRTHEERDRYDVAFYMPWIGPLLAPATSPPTGGAETQVYLVAQALAAAGLRVCIVAFDTPAGLPDRVGRVDVHARRPYASHKRLIGKVYEAFSIWGALAHLDTKVIVTRTSGPHVGIIGAFARLWRKRFVYSSAHVGDFTLELEKSRRNRALYKLGVRLADSIVVQTEEQVELCRNVFGREPVRIRSIAEPQSAAKQVPEAFIWVGRAIYYKQPLKYLELARRVPEASFRMVAVSEQASGTELYDQVKRHAESLPNFDLIDPLPRAELLELIERSVAVVNTSDSEGLSNIFLEGWSRGVPALALAHDPDAIITRHGLGGFSDGSLDLLAEQARELWT